jgi:hypothetical protein
LGLLTRAASSEKLSLLEEVGAAVGVTEAVEVPTGVMRRVVGVAVALGGPGGGPMGVGTKVGGGGGDDDDTGAA